MTTYNTGNPLGSPDPRDLYDNAENLDEAVNSEAETWEDRFGQDRLTWGGMELQFEQAQQDRDQTFQDSETQRETEFQASQQDKENRFQQFLADSGYVDLGDYDADGPLTITARNEIFSKDGEYYRIRPGVALPYTTTGTWATDQADFVAIGDAALRQELAAPGGVFHVGSSGALSASLSDLAALSGMVSGQRAVAAGDMWQFDPSDLSELVQNSPYDCVAPSTDTSGESGAWVRLGGTLPPLSGGDVGTTNRTRVMVRIAQYPIGIGTVASRVYICSPQSGGPGYQLYELRRGVTTTTGSLGGNAELLRVTSIYNQSVAWVGRHAALSSSGNWAETQYTPAGTTTKFLATALESIDRYWALSGGVGGEYIEFNVPFNSDRDANLQFYLTPGSATDAQISIDGGVPETLDLSTSTAGVYRHALKASPGFHTVRVTAPSGGTVNVFGANYEDIRDAGRYDFTGGFVTWGGDEKWTSGEGANDYAILDADSGLFGGSFHGGETLSEESYIVDGQEVSLQGAPIIGQQIRIRQRTEIDWGNGSLVNSDSEHSFDRDGGYRLDIAFTGDVRSSTFYSAMHTTPESYTHVTFPDFADLAAQPDGFHAFRRTDTIVQRDPSTSRQIRTRVSLVDDRGNVYGGPAVRKVTGSYNKFYYGPAISGLPQRFTSFACATEKWLL